MVIYVTVIDSDRLEEWPDLFTEDGTYEIVPKENAESALPVGIMHCFGRSMLRDRITALRNANLFEPHTYRYMTSRLELTRVDANTVDMQSNYVVVQTLVMENRAYIKLVATSIGWCGRRKAGYQRKKAIYDTSRVQTLLVTPV